MKYSDIVRIVYKRKYFYTANNYRKWNLNPTVKSTRAQNEYDVHCSSNLKNCI